MELHQSLVSKNKIFQDFSNTFSQQFAMTEDGAGNREIILKHRRTDWTLKLRLSFDSYWKISKDDLPIIPDGQACFVLNIFVCKEFLYIPNESLQQVFNLVNFCYGSNNLAGVTKS